MRKLILLSITTILFSCKSTKQKVYPNYVIGVEENYERKAFSFDSLNIITPAIEIYHRTNIKSQAKYDDREIVKKSVVEILKSEMNKTESYNIDLMAKDYLSVNKVLEGKGIGFKYRNPELIIKAPAEIVIPNKKYSILFWIIGRYGDMNNGVMLVAIINNEKGIIELVDRYEFNTSPLDYNRTKKRIRKALSKIKNT